MNTSIRIRDALPADRSILEDCMAELQAFERSIEANRVEPKAIRGRYLDHLLAECETKQGSVLVAELDGSMVGFVCVLSRVNSEDMIELEPEYAYITDLIVLEPHRGTGIGGALMLAAEARAASQGAKRIVVGVLAANTVAHHLYHKLGYADQAIALEKRIGDGEGS